MSRKRQSNHEHLRRDIQRLVPRINTHNLRLFIQSLAYHSGNIINQSVIARALEVSSVTAKEYLEILQVLMVKLLEEKEV